MFHLDVLLMGNVLCTVWTRAYLQQYTWYMVVPLGKVNPHVSRCPTGQLTTHIGHTLYFENILIFPGSWLWSLKT